MKMWVIAVLFLLLPASPVVSVSADDTSGPGGSTSNSPSPGFGHHRHSKQKMDQESTEKKKEKELRDKKIDDAIKKAWEEK